MEKENKLMPCPFCGATEEYLELQFRPPICVIIAYVKCLKCDANGGVAKHSHLSENEDLETKAKDFWNNRYRNESIRKMELARDALLEAEPEPAEFTNVVRAILDGTPNYTSAWLVTHLRVACNSIDRLTTELKELREAYDRLVLDVYGPARARELEAELEQLKAELQATDAEIERLKEYARHKQNCPALREFYVTQCPKCGQMKSHWRSGVEFEHERLCENCENIWEPEKKRGECTCGLEQAQKGGE